jgi:3-O-methylgallate 3,4-dioxygenase
MAKLAAAFASSHSVMLAAELPDWISGFRQSDQRMPFYDREGRPRSYDEVLALAPAGSEAMVTPEKMKGRYNEAQEAMRRLKEEIGSARLDALIIVGDDQHELFQDRHMPSIAIYYGATIRNVSRGKANDPARLRAPEAWYVRAQLRRFEDAGDVEYACHRPLALHLIEGLVEREFDVSAVAGLDDAQHEGHAYSFVHRWYLNGSRLPIVPVFLNTYNPPNQPHPKRCVGLGLALRELIERYPGDARVGLLASGGLSHFMCEEDLDRSIIDALHRKDMDFLGRLDPRRLKAGSSEIRNWIVVASAARDLDITWLSYTPAYRTPALTGIGLGFARWSAR